MQLRMLRAYYHIVLHKDVEWFDMQDPAALPLQMTADAAAYGDCWGDKMGTSWMGVSTFIGGYTFAFLRGWPIALCMTGTLPFIAVGGVAMGVAMEDVMKETQSWYGKAASVAEETFYAMRTVVAMGGEYYEIGRYSNAVGNARKGGIKNQAKIGVGMGYTMGMCFLTYALAFYIGMRFKYDDIDNPNTGKPWKGGEVLGVFFCVLMGSFMIGTIDPGVKAWDGARISAARFFKARDIAPVIQCRDRDGRETIESIDRMELKEVHFCYPASPDVKVLNGLSLTVEKGQKVAVVGESGSGKSTVIGLLERFYDPERGEVLINGKNVRTIATSSLRACIGYVGQEPVLFATSIRENILQGAAARGGASEQELKKVIADAQLNFIDELPEKMDTYVGSGGLQMSGGQKQRIAIARALLKQARVLFFDEATSALDNVSEKMIQETIDNLSHSQEQLTMVTIAHRLSTVRGSDLIYVLSRGELRESGTHSQLMDRQGLYYALVASQDSAFGEAEVGAAVTLIKDPSGALQRQISNERSDSRSLSMKDERVAIDAEKEAAEKQREKEILKTYKVPMARLLGFCKQERGYFIPGVLAALFAGSSQPVTAILLVESMSAYYKPKDEMKSDVEIMCLYMVLVAVGEFFAVIIHNCCFGLLGESMTMRLRIALFSKVFEQEIGFHDDPENTPGSLTAALQIYAFRISNLIKNMSAKAESMAAIVSGLVLGFIGSWKMTLVLLGSIPITMAANVLQMVVLLGGAGQENEKIKRSQQIVSESVQNVRTVQACGIENRLSSLYAEIVKSAHTPIYKHMLAGLALGVSGGVMFFIMAGAFYIMAELMKSGDADAKGLMWAFMGIFFAAMGAGQAASMMGDASKATVAAHDAFKLLDRVSAINGMKDLGPTPTEVEVAKDNNRNFAPGRIKFKNVKFHYPFRPDVQVLRGVNFEVEQNTSVGLCGPSGGGKSTIMALLQRYYDPMEGTIHIGFSEQQLKDVNIRWWRQQVGFVGQEPILFNRSVRENVMYGLTDGQTISEDYLEKCRKMANLDFLDKDGGKGWATEVGPRGAHLSGGQKQRVAICRAMIRDPPVLLLDEATSALDSASERIVQEALEAARLGRTSFAIAHRLSTIQDSDVIMVIAEGVVLETGNHSELMDKNGVYAKLQRQAHRPSTTAETAEM
jgi:ATP-binding cassette subfamily B (MDR/TAP) protein 1